MARILALVVVDSFIVEAVVAELAYASWPRRILSSVIDAFAIGALSAVFLSSTFERARDSSSAGFTFDASAVRTLVLVSIGVQLVYTTGLHSWRGSTLGKMATRTMLVNSDGSKVSPQTAFVRSVALLAIDFVSGFLRFLPLIVNELSPLWSARRQTYHDRLAGTVVVLIDAAPNLTD